MAKKQVYRQQTKEQLFAALIKQGKRKGFLQAQTILSQYEKFKLSEQEQEQLLQSFENEGVEIIFPETIDETSFAINSDTEDPTELSLEEINRIVQAEKSTTDCDPLKLYIAEINKYPNLNHKETLALVRKIAEGDTEARTMMINCYLSYACSIAYKFIGTGMPILDLIQQANLGLIAATDKYNPNRGTTFATYSAFWIRQSILRYLDEQMRTIKIPAYLNAEIMKLKKLQAKFYTDNMRQPTDDELATLSKLSIARIKYLQTVEFTIISTEMQPDDDMEGTILDTISNEAAGYEPYSEIQQSEMRENILSFLNQLKDIEKTTLIMRHGLNGDEPKTLEQIGKELGYTKERIRQIEARALAKLRNMPGITSLYDFF